jgi:hypothetical protein
MAHLLEHAANAPGTPVASLPMPAPPPSRPAGLDALSDDDLDELLRTALAQRDQRDQRGADAGGAES